MAPKPASIEMLELGSFLTIVITRDDIPTAIPATLRSRNPLMITATYDPGIKKGESVLVLGHKGLDLYKTTATVLGKGRTGSQITINLQSNDWEVTERRRSTRTTVDLPAKFVAVNEGDDGVAYESFEGRFVDMSRTGGRVLADRLFSEGALIQWQITINDACARGLALVVACYDQEGAMALDFIEFSGSAYALVCSFLEDAAA